MPTGARPSPASGTASGGPQSSRLTSCERIGNVPLNCYIFFDVDDTLVEWAPRWQQIYAQVAAEAGVSVALEQVAHALTEVGLQGDCVRRHYESGNLRAFRLDHDGRVLAKLGVGEGLERHARRVAELLLLPEACHLYPEAGEVVVSLVRAGARLGIITGRPLARPDLTRFGIVDCFDVIFDAFAARGAKESGHMFHVAARVAAAWGVSAWHVGDSYRTDVLGARAAGLRPVLIDRLGKYQGVDCATARDLREAAEIVALG
jgi:putative hydrolase of the HAD superfamily